MALVLGLITEPGLIDLWSILHGGAPAMTLLKAALLKAALRCDCIVPRCCESLGIGRREQVRLAEQHCVRS